MSLIDLSALLTVDSGTFEQDVDDAISKLVKMRLEADHARRAINRISPPGQPNVPPGLLVDIAHIKKEVTELSKNLNLYLYLKERSIIAEPQQVRTAYTIAQGRYQGDALSLVEATKEMIDNYEKLDLGYKKGISNFIRRAADHQLQIRTLQKLFAQITPEREPGLVRKAVELGKYKTTVPGGIAEILEKMIGGLGGRGDVGIYEKDISGNEILKAISEFSLETTGKKFQNEWSKEINAIRSLIEGFTRKENPALLMSPSGAPRFMKYRRYLESKLGESWEVRKGLVKTLFRNMPYEIVSAGGVAGKAVSERNKDFKALQKEYGFRIEDIVLTPKELIEIMNGLFQEQTEKISKEIRDNSI